MSADGGAKSAGMRRVLVLGSSEIALAIVRALQARAPREVAVLGRDSERMAELSASLLGSGCPRVVSFEVDAARREDHAAAVDRAVSELGGVDLAILAVGVLGEPGYPRDEAGALRVMDVNFLGAASLLLHVARHMREAGAGTIVVLSSVAAERPRRANPVYAASKAGLDGLASGLGYELEDSGVDVMLVRPGFVHTRMTRGLEPAPFATTPEAVAETVLKGLDSGRHTVWAPPALRWPMLALGHLPRPLFRRLRK
jgi:decaprenylphospho-beta-D-erythro-pentofuranosid-2-ulose 2-reductase